MHSDYKKICLLKNSLQHLAKLLKINAIFCTSLLNLGKLLVLTMALFKNALKIIMSSFKDPKTTHFSLSPT